MRYHLRSAGTSWQQPAYGTIIFLFQQSNHYHIIQQTYKFCHKIEELEITTIRGLSNNEKATQGLSVTITYLPKIIH